MIGVELFAGSGGMGLGAKMSGIDVRIAVEKNLHAARTYLLNHPKTTVVVDQLQNIKELKLDRKGQPLILFGGPPCQGYSISNRKTRSKENPKNWLFMEFMRWVRMLNPEWAVIENVPGLRHMDKGFFLERICDEFHQMGYTPNVKVLNASDFGVPQKRERMFIVASREGIAFDFPIGEYNDMRVTVADALSDLPVLRNGDKIDKMPYATKAKSDFAKKMRNTKRKVSQNYVTRNSTTVLERYNYISQGENWRSIPEDLMSNYTDRSRCHSDIYRRLRSDCVSPVIANYRKTMLIHPTQNRGLSVREAARLQSFPDWYEFHGPLIAQQQQVGDAVPPILACSLFKRISETS